MDLLVPADSDFFFIRSNGSVISVMEAYQKAENQPLVIQNYANWTQNDGLQKFHHGDKYERRRLSGVKIRVGSLQVSMNAILQNTSQKLHKYLKMYLQSAPITILSNNSQQQLTISGYYGEIWIDIAEKLGLEYEVIEEQTYGLLQENGSWSGLAGMLHRNEVDIAVADFYATPSRKTIVDFAMPTDVD